MKYAIHNRKGQKIVTVIENEKGSRLAIVMHGLGGHKDQPEIRTFAEAYLDEGFTVVTFDTTHSYGESDGKYEDATTTNYYTDLEDYCIKKIIRRM
jgi:predicted alpha/beta-fold hydrolase